MKMNPRKKVLQEIIKSYPFTAVLVANKYKVIAAMLKRFHPELAHFTQDRLADIVFNAVNGDRDWRFLTEDKDKKVKKELARQWVATNEPGSYRESRSAWYNR